jgi:hypothetical protein
VELCTLHLKVNWCFGGIYRILLQGEWVNQARNKHEAKEEMLWEKEEGSRRRRRKRRWSWSFVRNKGKESGRENGIIRKGKQEDLKEEEEKCS